jgi:kinesin family protein C1
VGDLEAQIDVANEELMTLTEANEGLQQRLEADKLLYTKELDELRSALQAEKAAREAEASAHQETKQVLSEAQAESERRATELRAQKTELEARCAALTATESELRQNKAALEATVAARELDLETLAARGRAAEELRREMHETISELKGNIRVFCRVRPSPSSLEEGGLAVDSTDTVRRWRGQTPALRRRCDLLSATTLWRPARRR